MQEFMGVQCQPIAGHSLGWVFPMKETRFGGRESADLGLALIAGSGKPVTALAGPMVCLFYFYI